MKNVFSLDSPLIQTLSFVFDLILVNMLYILCCIPVVTIGAARAALYTCGNLWAEKDDAGATTFLKAFFKNLKTATPVWLILLAVGAFLVWDVWLLSVNSIPVEWLLWVLIAVPLVAYVIVAQSKGYGGQVPIAVAFSPDGEVTSITAMSNSETPGLGSRIAEESYIGQYVGKPAAALDASEVDLISGATISSKAALSAFNIATTVFEEVQNG